MRTLDEVITGLDICKKFSYCTHPQKGECPYLCEDNTCGQDDLYRDALHYLKEFKRISARLEKIALGNITETLEKLDNPPLTWDELRTMEGKPVWVESSDSFNRRRWMFVGEWFDDDEMRLFDMGYDYPDYVSKNGYESGTWQAYRKERK